jgi:hypothetical protein
MNLPMTPAPVRFDYTPLGSPATWIAGVLVAGDDGQGFRAFGSGFLAAPNLALTARHVIDEISKHFTGKHFDELSGRMPFGVQLARADVATGRLLKWDVADYHYSRTIDITAMTLEPAGDLARDFTWVLPRIDVVPPTEGSKITAFGFPHTTFRPIADGSFRVTLVPRTTEGDVKEVHPLYRDRGMLPFPCFHTNARFDAGMSGGPVFNEDGRVCGVVCSNLPPSAEGQEHISYASLIWPALGIRINQAEGAGPTPPRFLRSKAETGEMQVLNLDCMSVEAAGDGNDRLRYSRPAHK